VARFHKYIDQAPTINLAIKRSVFKDIGYFDEELLYGSDFDFTWRVNKSNIKIYNQPMALVRHDWGDLKQELKRGYRYGQAKTKLYRKHRTDTVTFLKRESTLVMYAGFLCLLPLAIIWPYLLLILLIPITKSLLERNGLALPLINFYTAYGALITYLNDTTWIKT
jgi:GT2 family glycosyltransferase